ncbi:unnamed protein product [Polarella glacialis]|uniref:Uncharacterized protein n=1 Tax=Polarella glacialis TaxID=89957 RepID=A0A813DM88_POLGL|nr:unnamed protein product [Polarella glacialis]
MNPGLVKLNDARQAWLDWHRSKVPPSVLDHAPPLWPTSAIPTTLHDVNSEPPYAQYAAALEQGASALRQGEPAPDEYQASQCCDGVVRHALTGVLNPKMVASTDDSIFVVSGTGQLMQSSSSTGFATAVDAGLPPAPDDVGKMMTVDISKNGWRIKYNGKEMLSAEPRICWKRWNLHAFDFGVVAFSSERGLDKLRGDIMDVSSANELASWLNKLPRESHLAIVLGSFWNVRASEFALQSSKLQEALGRLGLRLGIDTQYSLAGPLRLFTGIAADGNDLFCAFPSALAHYDLDSKTWRFALRDSELGVYSGEDGPVAEAGLGAVQGLSMDHSDVYWADPKNHVIRCLHRPIQTVHRVLGVFGAPGCSEDMPPLKMRLRAPEATAVADHLVFIADTGNGRVLCLDLRTQAVSVMYRGVEPNALAAAQGRLFVADRGLHKIFHVDLHSQLVHPVLGTGHQGGSKDMLPPLSTNLNGVCDMAIGRGGELLVADQHNHVLRGLQLRSAANHAVDLPPCLGTWQSADIPQELFFTEPADHEQGLAMMPYRGAMWHDGHQLSAPMHLSPPLSKAKTIFRAKLARPGGDLLVSLVPGQPPSHATPLDAHALMSPEWNDRTYLQQTSKMGSAQPLKSWHQKIDTLRALFRKILKEEQPPAHFYLRAENTIEATIEQTYDPQADSKTWTLTELKVNGKIRGGSLEPLTVGIDVPIMICLFACDGQLKLLNIPLLM